MQPIFNLFNLNSDLKGRLSTLKHESEFHSEKQQKTPKPNIQKMSKDSDGPSSNEESDIEQETDEKLQLEDLNDKTVNYIQNV